jgi:hypothetical protein
MGGNQTKGENMSCPESNSSTSIAYTYDGHNTTNYPFTWLNKLRAVLLVTVTTALVACGGGGSSEATLTTPSVSTGGSSEPPPAAPASKDVVYNQNGNNFGGPEESIWAIVDKDGVFRMVGQRTTAGVTQTMIALGDGSVPMSLTASGALSGENCYQHWGESSCASSTVQLSASGNISVNRPSSASLGALMFLPQVERLTSIVTPTTSSLVGVFGNATRFLTIFESGAGGYNMQAVTGTACNLQGQISGLGSNTMKLSNVKFIDSGLGGGVCAVSNDYTYVGTAFIDRVGGLDFFNLLIDCQSSSCNGDGYDSTFTYFGPKHVELQRKVSHYLQPILSHRFLNNLA